MIAIFNAKLGPRCCGNTIYSHVLEEEMYRKMRQILQDDLRRRAYPQLKQMSHYFVDFIVSKHDKT